MMVGGLAFSLLSGAVELKAFQLPYGMSKSGETCAFTLQMDKVSFRQRYMQKIAEVQSGKVTTELSAVEEMYSNVQEASLFSFDEESPSAKELSNRIGVDPLSIDCLGCHDGSGASNITINLKNDPMKRVHKGLRDNSADHPIGMDYAMYAARAEDYKPIFGRSKMILVNGKVGCLTCHDPFNKEKGHLVMSDRGSALCLTCHNK
ncbi:cytochrome c3 family protein [Geomonas sp. RF6]|uniref:cytochrome c3 family protein n=1 Tax=Geomonas sp. RF6 TaxID=2897342 RepID=UPI001E4D5579|nr:cytochrome c3 family protein [Geomonas sp. RF6]UFS71023.1 cytochrome c3 family protein [Geomonas sp. RF6]